MLVAGGGVRRIRERCGEGSDPPLDGGGMWWCWKTTTNLKNEHEHSFSIVVVLAVSKRKKRRIAGAPLHPLSSWSLVSLLYLCHSSWGGAYQAGEVCMVVGGSRGERRCGNV